MKHGFMIRRTKGTTLILSPFENPVTAGSWEPQEEVVWYGSTILTTGKRMIVARHVQEHRPGVDRWIDARHSHACCRRLGLSSPTFFLVGGPRSVLCWTSC